MNRTALALADQRANALGARVFADQSWGRGSSGRVDNSHAAAGH